MTELVTIAVPIYKRLEYLPHVLNVIQSQDYPKIELLVSDNGMNGPEVQNIVKQYYSRPSRCRQNITTVSMSTHFNQLIHASRGHYFVILADDDEISPNYVSALVTMLERHPQAAVAIGVQEVIDKSGAMLERSSENVPEILSGPDFIKAAWGTKQYRFTSFSTFLARTASLSQCGGYPDLWKGSGNDDALFVKLSLGNYIAMSGKCSFRKRFDDASYGYGMAIEDLARSIREFLDFLDDEPMLREYARLHPAEWRASKNYLIDTAWKTYYYRWTGLYRDRLSYPRWVRAAFALPYIPAYYRAVANIFVSLIAGQARRYLPGTYDILRAAKSRYQRTVR